jgi:hypothetical protein
VRLIIASLIILALHTSTAKAQVKEIAVCGDLTGYSYNHNSRIVQRTDAGWVKDQISRVKTVLKEISPDKYDLLVLDASGSIWSAVQDGGKVLLLRKSPSELTFLHRTSAVVIEI